MSRRDHLIEIAQTIGEVAGRATSRLKDGTEVAWAANVIERGDDRGIDHADDSAAPGDDVGDNQVVTVVGASEDLLLLLRVVAGPFTAMQIVRSLCHRGPSAPVGTIMWLEPEDMSLAPLFSRPSAYLLVSPCDVGIEHGSPELLVAAGLSWREVVLPLDELRAIVIARNGVAPPPVATLTGPELRTAAMSMLAILKQSTDDRAISIVAYGLSQLIERGAAAALIQPLADVLRDGKATLQARESAAHLLDEAGAIESVIELVLADETRHVALPVVTLRALELLADIAITEPLAGAITLGLPDGFMLDSDERIADVEAAIQREPVAWAAWLAARCSTTS